jgi:hypothetical protein
MLMIMMKTRQQITDKDFISKILLSLFHKLRICENKVSMFKQAPHHEYGGMEV